MSLDWFDLYRREGSSLWAHYALLKEVTSLSLSADAEHLSRGIDHLVVFTRRYFRLCPASWNPTSFYTLSQVRLYRRETSRKSPKRMLLYLAEMIEDFLAQLRHILAKESLLGSQTSAKELGCVKIPGGITIMNIVSSQRSDWSFNGDTWQSSMEFFTWRILLPADWLNWEGWSHVINSEIWRPHRL